MNHPAQPPLKKASAKIKKLTDAVYRDVKLFMKQYSPDVAVNIAWAKNNVQTKLYDYMTDAIITAMGVEAGVKVSVENATKFYLDKVWDKTGLTLSAQIHKLTNDTRVEIQTTIKRQIRKNKAWTAHSKAVDDLELTSGDISKRIKELNIEARILFQNKADTKKYQAVLKSAERDVLKLSANGAPTTRLKKSYQRVIKATQKGNIKALDNAMISAIKSKARYNTDRIARTEIARAYGESFNVRMHADDDIVGYQSVLSGRHSITDICDFYAEADLYGMGAGVFPKTEGAPYPYHPQCMCLLVPVYRGESTGFNPNKGASYLKKNPQKAKKMFTKRGLESIKNNPESWGGNMLNYSGMVSKAPKIPVSVFKAQK